MSRDALIEGKSSQPPLTYKQIESSFDEECPLPPRGNLVRVGGLGKVGGVVAVFSTVCLL